MQRRRLMIKERKTAEFDLNIIVCILTLKMPQKLKIKYLQLLFLLNPGMYGVW